MGKSAKSGNFRAALDDTLQHLSQALVKRERLQEQLTAQDGRVDDLQSAADSIGRLCGVDPREKYPELFPASAEPELGFTDAVRRVFKTLPDDRVFLDPMGVRDGLKVDKFPLAKYKNPLASIHTILKRLHEQGELKRFEFEDMVRYGLKTAENERVVEELKEK